VATLSIAAAVALAFGTSGQPPCVPIVHWSAAAPADLLLSVAMEESGLDPRAVRQNENGTRDWGLLQINDTNLDRLGLTPRSALDPCASMRAASRMLLEAYDGGVTDREKLRSILRALSVYHSGSPTRGAAYARRVVATAETRIIPALAGILPRAASGAAVASGAEAVAPQGDTSHPHSDNLLQEPPGWARSVSLP
jgi:hypothetical protein